jgi:S-adenosylmethionine hydrolase
MGRRFDTVSFLSDFGTDDELVGVVKAVLRDLAPHAVVIDLTHGIAPCDVRAGGLSLARAIGYVPEGIVLACIDPGAGGRPPVAVEVAGGAGVILGPDNGLIAPAVAMAGGAERAVLLDRIDIHLAAPGVTMTARDVLAPVAAQLCNGVDLADLGTEIDAELLVPGVVPLPRDEGDGLVGEVLAVDRFGNCQLNIGPDDVVGWGDQLQVTIGEITRVAARARTFGDVGPGAVGVVVDGAGMLSLVLDRRSAAEELSCAPGDQAMLRPLQASGSPGVTTPVSLRPIG